MKGRVVMGMICTRVAVAGVSSEVGKTTLLCELLRRLRGWEAIKMTRGHYRSCGKDPHACCVSHLLGDEPLVRSGFRQTYASDKDTGRYWDAGAGNVHWVVVTDEQVERGLGLALERVRGPGVLIEGNSFLRFADVDFAVLVAGNAPKGGAKIKASTRWAFQKASALYVTGGGGHVGGPDEMLVRLNERFAPQGRGRDVPAYSPGDLAELAAQVARIHSARASAGGSRER